MDFALITDINGQLGVKSCRTKKAFLQKISELIDECEAKGATLFDLILNTDIGSETKEA
jgi:hypothetical protein